jgi:hypothetical protein
MLELGKGGARANPMWGEPCLGENMFGRMAQQSCCISVPDILMQFENKPHDGVAWGCAFCLEFLLVKIVSDHEFLQAIFSFRSTAGLEACR